MAPLQWWMGSINYNNWKKKKTKMGEFGQQFIYSIIFSECPWYKKIALAI